MSRTRTATATRRSPAPAVPRRVSGPIRPGHPRPVTALPPRVVAPVPARPQRTTGVSEKLRALPDHRWLDALLRPGGRMAAISFHSLEDRRVKRFLAERAQGCTCPPDLPICVCGHEAEAELIGRGGVVPTPGEVAANPRSKSARLRAARKLTEEEVRA